MILTVEEFNKLRNSDKPEKYSRATEEMISIEVCKEIITKGHDMKVWIIRNKKVDIDILRILANDSDYNIRLEVAMKRKLDRPLFEQLAIDSNENVRRRLAINKKIPSDILELLASDKDRFVSDVAQLELSKRDAVQSTVSAKAKV